VVKGLEDGILLSLDVAVDEVWRSFGELVVHVSACWDGKDVVQFLKRTLLRLWDPQENHHERDEIGSGVEAEDTGGAHG